MATSRRRREPSTTTDWLAGFPYRGKRIRSTWKIGGAHRVIEFTDGTTLEVHRADLHELAKFKGLLVYRGRYLRATLPEKAAMLKKSQDRQMAILENYKRDLTDSLPLLAPSIANVVRARLRALSKQEFGSPLIGATPATSVTPPNYGPQKTFKTTNDVGISFRTIRDRHGRTRVIPIRVDFENVA